MSHVDEWLCHLDLHETTDTDETEFRPAKAARDGITDSVPNEIPDGFYLGKLRDACVHYILICIVITFTNKMLNSCLSVQDETTPLDEWFTAMIESVKMVTHIAPADHKGELIGEKVSQEGVIVIPCKRSLGLCAGVTNAKYRTTTEVYPDSPKATPEQCNRAQVACIVGGLDHIISVL